MERMLVSVHSGPVAIISEYRLTVSSISTIDVLETVPTLSVSKAALFGVTKQTVVPPNTETMVLVRTLEARLNYLPAQPEALKTCLMLPTSLIVETVAIWSFCILIVNISTWPTDSLRHILAATEVDSREMVVHFRPGEICPRKKREDDRANFPFETEMTDVDLSSENESCRPSGAKCRVMARMTSSGITTPIL